MEAKEAEDKHILAVHSQRHVNLIKKISSRQFDSRRDRIASNLNSIYLNEGTSEAAYLAAGSAIEVVSVTGALSVIRDCYTLGRKHCVSFYFERH